MTDETTQVADETPAADTVSVAVAVPAEHVDLIERAVALLQRGEQFIIDNIEAGVAHFEVMFKDESNNG